MLSLLGEIVANVTHWSRGCCFGVLTTALLLILLMRVLPSLVPLVAREARSLGNHPMLRTSASGPEIEFAGRCSAGF